MTKALRAICTWLAGCISSWVTFTQVHLGRRDVGVRHRAGLKAGLGDFQVGCSGMAGLLDHRQVLLGQLQPEIGLSHLEQQLLPGTQDVAAAMPGLSGLADSPGAPSPAWNRGWRIARPVRKLP